MEESRQKNEKACSEFRQKVVDRTWVSKSSKDVKDYYESNGAGLVKIMFADVSITTVFTSKIIEKDFY